jgi:hypothetical protein
MATCPSGHENPEGQRFCGECGERIAPPEPAPTEPVGTPAGAGEDDYPSRAWQQQPPKRSKVNTRPFWITVGSILGLVVLIGVIAGVVGANNSDDRAADCPSGQYYDDDVEACTPHEPSTTYSIPAATLPSESAPTPMTASSPPPPPPPPPPSVTYDLTGQGSVSVTMQNASGGTEQFETRLPYHLDLGPAGTFGGLSGFVYISAQLQSSGTVTCEIKKGDQVIQSATSSGEYVIASCSGSV